MADSRDDEGDQKPSKQEREVEELYRKPLTRRDRRERLREIGRRYGRWQ